MEPGDIVTHFFTANPGGVLDTDGNLVPEAREAHERGVWLDTAHGRANFSFDIGERVLDQGVEPHCISTDLTVPGRIRTVHSMTEMMTRFLAMGFTLDRVVEMCTINPARAIGEGDRLGSLEVGKQADVSVLDIVDGSWVVYDVLGTGRSVGTGRCSRHVRQTRPGARSRLGPPALGLGTGHYLTKPSQ